MIQITEIIESPLENKSIEHIPMTVSTMILDKKAARLI